MGRDMEPQDVYTQSECPKCGCPLDSDAWHVLCDYRGEGVERTYVAADAWNDWMAELARRMSSLTFSILALQEGEDGAHETYMACDKALLAHYRAGCRILEGQPSPSSLGRNITNERRYPG